MTPKAQADRVKAHARALGFDAVGITDLSPVPHRDTLDQWLTTGMAGTMRYMHRQAARRAEPATILPGATRAVVVTRNHFNPTPGAPPGGGQVARYARGPDYHVALAAPLSQLAAFVRGLGPAGTRARAYIDAGPVPERELAQRAGIGWIGKNTMLIDPRRGSHTFIATVLTDLALAVDEPFEPDRCGSCTRCLTACPTEAFPAPRVLDSRRCISYLTIEYRGDIDSALAPRMGTWVFGCDVCQDVCPWNEKFARSADDPLLATEARLAWLDLAELATIDDAEFHARYGHTPLQRPGPGGMRRNAGIAAANAERNATCQAP